MYFANLLDRNTPLTHLAHLLYKTQRPKGVKGCRAGAGGEGGGFGDKGQGDRLTGEAAAEPDCSPWQKEVEKAAGFIGVIVASSSLWALNPFFFFCLAPAAFGYTYMCMCMCVSRVAKWKNRVNFGRQRGDGDFGYPFYMSF